MKEHQLEIWNVQYGKEENFEKFSIPDNNKDYHGMNHTQKFRNVSILLIVTINLKWMMPIYNNEDYILVINLKIKIKDHYFAIKLAIDILLLLSKSIYYL